jgi:hypothetical protein
MHRYPVVTKELEPWELAMSELQEKISAQKRKASFILIKLFYCLN